VDETPDGVLPDLPAGFKRHGEPRFGFSVALPQRFHLLANTIDPLARSLRQLHDLPKDEEARQQARWPEGFWDPQVIGELDDGRVQPLRVFEFDAIGGRSEPLTQEEADDMWMGIQQFMPSTLEGGDDDRQCAFRCGRMTGASTPASSSARCEGGVRR